jgi:hypothetical protein
LKTLLIKDAQITFSCGRALSNTAEINTITPEIRLNAEIKAKKLVELA